MLNQNSSWPKGKKEKFIGGYAYIYIMTTERERKMEAYTRTDVINENTLNFIYQKGDK